MVGSDDVRAAARFLEGKVVKTPVLRIPDLDRISGAELWLKAENLQHIGAFKARGALLAVSRLDPRERARGVITYSSGNHAQAVALAARSYGVSAHITMPEDAPAIKVAAVRALGASVLFASTTSEDRRLEALRIQERSGGAIIPPFDHPDIIAGQGTATLELLDQAGGLDLILVPVGGGGLCAGACLAAAERGVEVYSVEPSTCDAMAQSMEKGQRVTVMPGPTIADGLRPVQVGELNFAIAQKHLSGWLRVDDEAIGRALASALVYGKILVEPSGAAALAAALTDQRFAGKRVGVILSGGNIGLADLGSLLQRYPAH
jgi:threonine dehydratase